VTDSPADDRAGLIPYTPSGLIALAAGPLLAILAWTAPAAGLSLDAERPLMNRVLGVALWMAAWWITEAAPPAATALLPLVLFPLLGVMPARQAALGYADDNIYLYLGGFLLALAVEESGLHRRVALTILSAMGDRPPRLVAGFLLTSALLSMWLSNSAVALLVLPIAVSLLKHVEQSGLPAERLRHFAPALVLAVAYGASLGGLGTPIGSPPNLVYFREFQERFPAGPRPGFAEWMIVLVPPILVMLLGAWWILVRGAFRVTAEPLLGGPELLRQRRAELGPFSIAERRTAALLLFTAAAWITREPAPGYGWSPALGLERLVTDATIAMVAAVAVLIVPRSGIAAAPLVPWTATARLPWSILLLFGGGVALANGMKAVELDAFLALRLAELLGALPALGRLLVLALGVTALTELTSNLACVQLSLPVLAEAAAPLGCDPRFLMLPATICASLGFALPVATPPNAIAYGSGRVPIRDMIRAGLYLDALGVLIVVVAMYLWIGPWLQLSATVAPAWAAAG
jgi:sodium-dependent dicarboxylate transporter 2/3/5